MMLKALALLLKAYGKRLIGKRHVMSAADRAAMAALATEAEREGLVDLARLLRSSI